MSSPDDKITVAHVNAGLHQTASAVDLSAEERIIHHLETTGEEVGLTWRSTMAAAAMALSYNAYLFTLVMPPAIISVINAQLGPSTTSSWVLVSWNLGGAIFVTVGGRLSDIFGRRYFFLAGGVLLIIGSIVGATGQSIGQMIASGAIFGAGSGFLEMAYGAVQEIVPNEYRMVTVGIFDISALVAQIMPLVAWAIIKYTQNWRNCYYIILAFECLTVIFLWFFYHPPAFHTKHATTGKTATELLKDFDWLGLFLFVAGCTLFIVGVNWGGSLYPWTSATTIAPIVVGLCTLAVFGIYETFGNLKEPLLPTRLFAQVRTFTMPIIVISIVGMQFYSNSSLWPRMSQLLYAGDEISKGLYAEVVPLGSIVGGFGIICSKRLGHQRWQIVLAVCLQTACVGAMSTATVDNPVKSIILTFLISFCTTIVILNCFVIVGFGIVYQEDIGTAAGLAGTSRLLFGAVATAMFGNIANNRYADSVLGAVRVNIADMNFPEQSLAALVGAAKLNTAAAYAAVPGITSQVQAAATLANKQAYLMGTQLSYYVALGFGLVACVAALFIQSIDERKYTKKTVAIQEADRKALENKKLVMA